MEIEMDDKVNPKEKKKLSLKVIGQEEVSLTDTTSTEKNETVTGPDNIGVTVAAFMLNAESQSSEIGFGSGNSNTEDVRNEILKAIKEEGDNF